VGKYDENINIKTFKKNGIENIYIIEKFKAFENIMLN